MKLLLAGASTEPVCGTRDYAQTLAEPLRRAGAEVHTVWWERRERPLEAWTDELRRASAEADVVLWQYSVFTYGKRGLPTLVPHVLRALRSSGTPILTVCHELVFPWGSRGLRGAIHAASQRAALLPVVRASAGLVVTTDERREWLTSRAWLPQRPVRFLPVVSNVPPAAALRPGNGLRVGVFGFRRESLPIDVVTAAVARTEGAELVLVGAPGPDSAEARCWREAGPVSFSGVLDRSALASELAGLDVVLFPDPIGPTPRRGTLAAALAHGKPVVAFDGPQTWSAYVEEGALVVVPQTADALTTALGALTSDRSRAELGARARAFHDAHLAPDVIAHGLLSFAEEVRRG